MRAYAPAVADDSAQRAGALAGQLEKVHADIQTLLGELAAIRSGGKGRAPVSAPRDAPPFSALP